MQRHRMLLALAGTALILGVSTVLLTVLMRPNPTYMRVADISIAHFQKALEDLVKHQDVLCQQLRDLQAGFLPHLTVD